MARSKSIRGSSGFRWDGRVERWGHVIYDKSHVLLATCQTFAEACASTAISKSLRWLSHGHCLEACVVLPTSVSLTPFNAFIDEEWSVIQSQVQIFNISIGFQSLISSFERLVLHPKQVVIQAKTCQHGCMEYYTCSTYTVHV